MIVFFKKTFCSNLWTNLYFLKSRSTARVNNAVASNQKTTMIKTLRKWKKKFRLKLGLDVNSKYKVCCIQCSDYNKLDSRIKEVKTFSVKWIRLTENVAKDAVEKQANKEPH